MPELPEVETVRNILKKSIINKKITNINVIYHKIIKNLSVEQFSEYLVGQTIIDISRLGKYLIFVLDDYYLISHLRMEGKYLLKTTEEITKHEHIIFYFDSDNLRYADTRKFGTMHVYRKDTDIYQHEPLNKLGPEPFELNLSYLQQRFSRIQKPIKSTLLDQTIISGLGNIYVDEVLFLSNINPLKKTNLLTPQQIESLITNSQTVLNKAIKLGGTTIRTFTSGHEISGRFQNELLVHTKKQCPNCGRTIEKIFVGGRGTYHCQHCQSLNK